MNVGEIEKNLNEVYSDVAWDVLVVPYIKESSCIGKRSTHSKENPYAWEKNIISSKLDFSKPIVLCLGGTGVDDDQSANGVAKIAQKLLGFNNVEDDRLKSVQLLSVVYPKDLKRLSSEREKFKRGEPRKKLDYIEGIYNTVFRPIIFPKDVLFESYGDVKRKLRNITILSHCHGTFVACELLDYLREDLKKISKSVGTSEYLFEDLLCEITNIMLSPREGVQRAQNALNIGFTFAVDGLKGGVDDKIRKGADLEVYDFSSKLRFKKIKGSDTFYYKVGSLYSFWDTDTFGSNLDFIENSEADWGAERISELVYENFYAKETPFYHLFDNYCDFFAKCEDDRIGRLQKNEKARNFTKIIAKVLQNSVSLSILGQKKSLNNLVSNDTQLTFYQGEPCDNLHFKDVKFDGDLEIFANNYKKLKKILDPENPLVNNIISDRKSR